MNILITSVGRRTYIVKYFKEALQGIGEVHAANSFFTYPMQVAHKYVVTPPIHEKSYIGFLLNYCLKNTISAVISLFDYDLLVLSKNKHYFDKAGVQLINSDYSTIKICNDKWALYKYLKENDLPAVQSYISLESCFEDINNKLLSYPLIIKPRWGAGSIGIYRADNHDELKVLYQKVRNTISETYLKHTSNAKLSESIVIQEKIEEAEYGLDIFNDLDGNFLSCIPKRKLEIRSGETESAEIIDSKLLSTLGIKLSLLFRHKGNLDVDLFLRNGNFLILEINCRFGGQYPFAHLAGANFPKAIVNMLSGIPVTSDLLSVCPGTTGFKDIEPVVVLMNN